MVVTSFNPYFTGLPILIEIEATALSHVVEGFNPYFTGLPILIEYKIVYQDGSN